ncbi:MAG TPA: tripartite tricarboxylate transporter TctB family protein, partial [Candidatus Limnocylindria bacterium]|nr:tripartite tricarboxylate transporter TctB family protein [Candidatus Limnocylindria bacterium]
MTLRHPDAIGSIVIALVAFLVIAAGLATPDPGFGVVGPAAFPIAIGALMLIVAAWLGWDTWRHAVPMVLDPIDRRPFVSSLVATAAFLLAFEPVGFMISGAA